MGRLVEITAGLFKHRHELPCDRFIFDKPLAFIYDFKFQQKIIKKKLSCCSKLDLYVTGLTPALVEVINYCMKNRIILTLWHYDTIIKRYRPQKVWRGKK